MQWTLDYKMVGKCLTVDPSVLDLPGQILRQGALGSVGACGQTLRQSSGSSLEFVESEEIAGNTR